MGPGGRVGSRWGRAVWEHGKRVPSANCRVFAARVGFAQLAQAPRPLLCSLDVCPLG